MPYSTINDLPENLKHLPTGAKTIFMKAFNAAHEQYKGDDAKASATAWTAIKAKYKKVDDSWVAKESSLSDDNKKDLLNKALSDQYQVTPDETIPKTISIDDVFDEHIIYRVNSKIFKASYQLDDEGNITFGEPAEVIVQKQYSPVESLQDTYSEIIQEAGRRNASLDSDRIKKIMMLCQELLSSDAPDTSKLKKATKEAKTILAWVKEQEAVRVEDGVSYPAEAFAYTPDKNNPDKWKLRIWESAELGVTKDQLSKVAASLSPGGYKGKLTLIKASDLPAVMRNTRAAYRSIGIDDDDMSRWVKEDMTRELAQNYIPLTEATFNKGRAKVIVIKPGFNASEDRYYPAEMLKRDYKVFEGQKMYADHPTEQEEKSLPERSIKNTGWVAVLKQVQCDENGVVTGVAEIIEPWLMEKLATLRDKKLLSEMGISINAVGRASKAIIEGKKTLVIEELTGARSVDFVTEPGAGGIVTFYESDRSRDLDLVELSGLKEKRPDLVKLIEADVRKQILGEVKKKMELEERVTELEGLNKTLTTENADLKTKMEEADKAKAKAEAQATVKEAVDKAELPEAAKEKLIERFKDADSAEGIVEAIQSEKDYIAKLSEAGKPKAMGNSNKSTPEADQKALKESFKRMHPEWTDAQIETATSGR